MAVKAEEDVDLDLIAQWESRWDIQFHPQKYSVHSVTRNQQPGHRDYTLRDQNLPVLQHETSVKYHGVTITSDLRWKPHINNICSKANKTLRFHGTCRSYISSTRQTIG